MSYEYKHPRQAVTADAVVITQKEPRKVLTIERGGEPFKGCWTNSPNLRLTTARYPTMILKISMQWLYFLVGTWRKLQVEYSTR